MELLAKTCNYDVMDGERIAARLFVGVGIFVWAILAFGSLAAYGGGMSSAVGQAFVVLAVTVVALAIGWFFENLAAVFLFLFAAGSVVWGLVMGWEPGVWGLMGILVIAPPIIAGLLFIMAAQMQKACDLAAKR